MKRVLPVVVVLLLAVVLSHAQDDGEITGFGNQPIRLDPLLASPDGSSILIKKVLGSTVYTLTPGDTYELIVKLENTERAALILPPDYRLELPYLGTYDARGQTFAEFRSRIIRDIKNRLPVAEFVDFILTSPALFDVMIYGGVKTPGNVTATPLNTVWEVLAAAGGVKPGGSFRRIRLIRGEETKTCDLALFTRTADTSQNPLLRPGDTIFVPHPETVVKAEGALLYPDPYELIAGETLEDLLRMAGGLRPEAMTDKIEITRIEDGRPSFFSVALEDAEEVVLRNGDRIHVPSLVEAQDTVVVEAALYGKPAAADSPRVIPQKPLVLEIPYAPGMSVLSVLDALGGPTPLADPASGIIYRGEERKEVPVDAKRLWKTRDPALNPALEPGDHLFIPQKKLAVVVAGEVQNPGLYPYTTAGLVSDYLGAAGGILPRTASLKRIYLVSETGERELAELTSPVYAGATLYVDRNNWQHTSNVLREADTVVVFTTSLVALIASLLALFFGP